MVTEANLPFFALDRPCSTGPASEPRFTDDLSDVSFFPLPGLGLSVVPFCFPRPNHRAFRNPNPTANPSKPPPVFPPKTPWPNFDPPGRVCEAMSVREDVRSVFDDALVQVG